MSASEIVNDQMEKMREELATANQQIGVITECLEIQGKILSAQKPSLAGIVLDESNYRTLLDLSQHMHNACRRA